MKMDVKIGSVQLLEPTALDGAAVMTLLCLLLGHKLWERLVTVSNEIPDSFWYIVPQASTDSAETAEVISRTRNIQKEIVDRNLQMVIFWGSQTGKAEMLARRFAKALHDRYNLHVLAADLNDYDHTHLLELQTTTPCAFIMSTYGDGDPPDNTNGLWMTLQKLEREGSTLNNLRYMMFGLGNSNYRLYNRVSEHVDQTLQTLGAVRYGPVGRGDDADGSTEASFLQWRSTCEGIIKSELQLHEQDAIYRPAFAIENQSDTKDVYLGEPYQATSGSSNRQNDSAIKPLRISGIQKMWEDAERVCLHVDIDLGADRSIKYKTGDHIAIWPSNSNEQVDRLLSVLELRATSNSHQSISIIPVDEAGAGKLTIPTPTTVDALLRYYLEIAGPVSLETVADLAHFTTNEESRKDLHCITADLATFQNEVTTPCLTLADLLYKINPQGGWNIPLSFLLERLKPMRPRLYSIASSPMVNPQGVSICLVTDGNHGITTSYLHAQWARENNLGGAQISTYTLDGPGRLLQGGKIFAQVQRSTFKQPLRTSMPVILVGAGTGVAPFRGFLEDRARYGAMGQEVGKTLLFMGFRHPDVDFSYKTDWETWQEALGGNVFKFWTAFSRLDEARKVYVQDRIRENGSEVLELLTGPTRCRMLICGSANMARDVVNTLREMKMRTGCDEEEATAWIRQLRQSKLLMEECWG